MKQIRGTIWPALSLGASRGCVVAHAHTMLTDALALAVKFIPFDTYRGEHSHKHDRDVSSRFNYKCKHINVCVCMCVCARANTVFMFSGRERPLLYIMYGRAPPPPPRVYFAPHIGLTLSHLQSTTILQHNSLRVAPKRRQQPAS